MEPVPVVEPEPVVPRKWASAGIGDGLRPGIILRFRFQSRNQATLSLILIAITLGFNLIQIPLYFHDIYLLKHVDWGTTCSCAKKLKQIDTNIVVYPKMPGAKVLQFPLMHDVGTIPQTQHAHTNCGPQKGWAKSLQMEWIWINYWYSWPKGGYLQDCTA